MSPCENSLSSFHIIQEVENTNDENEYTEKNQLADFEAAVNYARYGKFQHRLLAICGTIYATCAISTTTLSFVLPSAECDFVLSSADKGKLSAMPLIGMIFGCGFWGSMADCHGRKTAIMMALCVDFLAAVSSSVSKNYDMFLVCRFFNGFGIIGATSVIFSYLGEFLAKQRRDVMLGRLEIFWTIGSFLLPGVAWLFLSEIFQQYFQFHQNFSPWRIFTLVCGFPSLLSIIFLYFLPETPKFLLSKRRFDKARGVFKKMFTCNTGYPGHLFPLLIFDGEVIVFNKSEVVASSWKKVQMKLEKFWKTLNTFFSQPFLKFILVIGFADFGLMASYYTLIMWFPEIFERFHVYELSHVERNPGICAVTEFQNFSNDSCDSSMENRVFIYTGLISLSCIPTAVSLSTFMRIFSKKKVLIGGLILAGISTLVLNLVRNRVQTLVVSCVFEALTSVLEAVLFCVVVDLFPTHLRAIAVAFTATSGRLGAIFGNILFGLLIDVNCVAPIYTFGLLLIGSGLLCLSLPSKDNYIQLD